MSGVRHGVESHTWTGDDFQPVVVTGGRASNEVGASGGGWIVALMNQSPRFDLSGWGVVERHPHTDEVFVLLKGQSVLFVESGDGVELIEMVPGVVYNVLRGTYHNVIGTRDVQWLIVEGADDPASPTEYRPLSQEEREALQGAFPEWLTRP